ncbi:uncharacterized protein LOC131329664 [Rhododendron vialii]|uniref:uncharacterized protein LOC131329664 n=1 Tax=Rhododendron vialii TaxID=182163 RepID=UPI00265F8BF0|nr:uncharacterized protein LOC131329664 [Rhododendron vialii]
MTTTEKLFVQIFDRKKRITEQVKQRTDLYRQHLASKILLDGYNPPLWLWNPNFNSESSDPQGLKKEELISELLLSHPRPAVPYSGGPYSAYDKPVVVRNNVELSEGLLTHASKKGFNTGDRPRTLHDNNIGCALNSVPELDLNSTSPQAQGEVRISDIHPDNGFSARDRITTMTECHDNDVGCSFDCVPEFDSSATSREQQAEVRISYIRSDNGFNVGDMPNCYDNDLDHAFNFDPDFSNGAASPRGQTEVRMAVTYTAPDQSLARLQRSKSRQKALEIRNSAKAAAKSRYAPENLTGACYNGNKMSRMVSQEIDHDIELFGLANYSDTVRECQGTAKNPNTYRGRITRSRSSYNLSSHESIAKEDGCPTIRSQSTCTEGTSKPVSSSYTASQRVALSKSGASKRCPLDNSLDRMERFQLNNVPGGEVVPHCPDSSAIVNKDVNADNIVETEVISNGLLEGSHESIAKEDGCPMIRSQSTSIEGTSKPVSSSYTASQRVTRSKSGASKRPPLDNSLDRMERFHLHNVPGGEVVPRCLDSSAIVNKDGNVDNIVETEVISDGLLEAQAAISESNLDLACPSVRFEASISRPPVFGMFVKPKTLDFGDMEKCLNKISGPMLEKGRLEKSAPKMSTPVKSATSDDKITFCNTSGKSLVKQSLEPNASNNKTDAWRVSSGTCVEECVVHNEDVSNNLMYVTDKSKSIQEIQHSLVSDGPDKLLSSAGKGFDEKYMVQVQECELVHDGRDVNGTTPFPFKNQELGPSFVSSRTKRSTAEQDCRVGKVGVTDPSSSGLDLRYCSAEDSQDLMHLEKSSDKGKMSGFVLRERTLLEKESHVVEDDLLAFGFTGSLELPLLQTSSLPVRRLRSAAENSWPQFKHRKVEDQQANFSSASPSCRAKEIHCIRVGGNLGTDLQSQYDGDVAQSSGDKIPDIEKHWEVKYNLTQETEPSAEMQLEQDELGFEKRNPGSDATSVFKNGHLGTSILLGFINDTAEGFQDCSFENVETADTTHIDLDVRMPGDEIHYINKLHSGNNIALENEDDLTHPERMLQLPCFEEGVPFSHSSIVSPQDKHLDSLDADQTMPEFERFMIDTEEDGDGFSLDKFDLPSTAIERASILEQLCRSASMHTPLPKFSTTFKLHRTPDLYQSVPNGLLEHTDLRSTLNLNDGGKQLRASYSNVGEVKSAFQGSSLSDCVPYSDSHFNWSLKEHPMSPVGKPWDWFSVKSSSSEKERSSNQELTCFPIEEDPNISEENDNGDEEADIILEDTCSALLNGGAKREPLAELTAVSAVERFPDRSSLDSVDTEVSVTEAHSKVRQPLGNRNNNKRRCTNEAKENSHFSVSTNCDKKATESLNSRFSKPKLLGKTSLRKGMQGLSEREPKHNNIVTNITSFVPFVQQKQAAAVATGKRDIKVKALEAAEAAKRLEEKKDNERKMKKEALKLERVKTEQENLRQMELKMKMKQEEQKKKDADMAVRKRLREEEGRKEKERKRQRIDMRRQQRDQGDKLRNRKVEKEVPLSTIDKKVICGTQSDDELRKVQKMGNKQGDDNIGKKPHTELGASEILTRNLRQAALEDCEAFPRCGDTGEPTSVLSKPTESNDLVEKTSREKSYEISPYQCSDDEDEEVDEIPTSKYIPSWASKTSVALVLSSQQNIDPDVIFPPESFCSSDEVLRPRK